MRVALIVSITAGLLAAGTGVLGVCNLWIMKDGDWTDRILLVICDLLIVVAVVALLTAAVFAWGTS